MTWLFQLFCKHAHTLIKTKGNRLYTECARCGKESPGVLTGFDALKDFNPRPVRRVRDGRSAVLNPGADNPLFERRTPKTVASAVIRHMSAGIEPDMDEATTLTQDDIRFLDALTEAHQRQIYGRPVYDA